MTTNDQTMTTRLGTALRGTERTGTTVPLMSATLGTSSEETKTLVAELVRVGLVTVKDGRVFSAPMAKGANQAAIREAAKFALLGATAPHALKATPRMPMRKGG